MTGASEAVRVALIAALRARPEMSGIDGLRGETGAGSLPQVSVEAPAVSDWGTKTERGRELRTVVRVRVARGQALRLPSMVAGAEAAGEGLAGDIGGWRVASAVLVRSRPVEAGDGTHAALIEHRVRVLQG